MPNENNEIENFEYTLIYPFTTKDGRPIDKLTFNRRPTGGQMRHAAQKYKTAEEREMFFIAHSTGIKDTDIDEMDCIDINGLQMVFADFLHQKKNIS